MEFQDLLNHYTKKGELYTTTTDNRLLCYACGHRCIIGDSKLGICKVRFNDHGILKVPYGYVGALQLDPIEKKPFFHALPGTLALSFGMLGCDFHCGYCQNWITSQAIRDPNAIEYPKLISPQAIVDKALQLGAQVITSTYNEPLITSEWAKEIFLLARQHGLKTSYVSNGNATTEVLDYMQGCLDFYKIDLKSFQDKHYRQLGGQLETVLNSIVDIYRRGIWLEIVTLLIPGFNDSPHEIQEMASYLASVSKQIPWHITAFHKDYKMTEPDNTSPETLIHAYEIGKEAGLDFVYTGNKPGQTGNRENTYCPKCQNLLIERIGFKVLKNNLENGLCSKCQNPIPGRWY